jgi:succinate dehydrogenase hydrophobic anchor subunit
MKDWLLATTSAVIFVAFIIWCISIIIWSFKW